MRKTPHYLTVPGVARMLGRRRQSIQERFDRGTMPPPDAWVEWVYGGETKDIPAWKPETIEKLTS